MRNVDVGLIIGRGFHRLKETRECFCSHSLLSPTWPWQRCHSAAQQPWSTFVPMKKKNTHTHTHLGKINDVTLFDRLFHQGVDCVETMHFRRRKWACLLCVSLLSGFVLTKKKKESVSENSAIKCSMVPMGGLGVCLLTVWVFHRIHIGEIPFCNKSKSLKLH